MMKMMVVTMVMCFQTAPDINNSYFSSNQELKLFLKSTVETYGKPACSSYNDDSLLLPQLFGVYSLLKWITVNSYSSKPSCFGGIAFFSRDAHGHERRGQDEGHLGRYSRKSSYHTFAYNWSPCITRAPPLICKIHEQLDNSITPQCSGSFSSCFESDPQGVLVCSSRELKRLCIIRQIIQFTEIPSGDGIQGFKVQFLFGSRPCFIIYGDLQLVLLLVMVWHT